MDMFKLLARSTGLQKSAASARNPSHQTPSAGGLSYEGFDENRGDQSKDAVEETPRGTKRKRAAKKEHATVIPAELNFFASSGAQTTCRQAGMPHEGSLQKAKRQESNAPNSNNPVTILSEEECRQILKKHRLKITHLDDEKHFSDRRNGQKNKARGTVQRKKDPHRQIWPQPLTSFADLRNRYNISARLAENMDVQGYRVPTEVQLGALPLLLGMAEACCLIYTKPKAKKKQQRSGVDLLTIAPTGSGKTLAFLVPVLQSLIEEKRMVKIKGTIKKLEHHVQAVIIAPTHELVDQIVNEARKLALGTGIKISGVKKGMRLHPRVQNTIDSADQTIPTSEPVVKAEILVSTPLMMLHANSAPSEETPQALPSVRFLVLDEADVLLDPLFRDQTLGVWKSCSNPNLLVSLWSATIGSSIETLARDFICSRRKALANVSATKNHMIRLVVGLKDFAIPLIDHRLIYAASEQGKLLALRQLLHPSAVSANESQASLQPPFLIFTQTILRAVALHAELLYDIPPEAGGSSRTAVLHSDLSDTARSNIMAGLRKGEIWIVITTDLLSRGVDIRGLNGVVNYDIPNTGAAYVHRVGRTGRQGREGGVAVTLYTKEDIPYVKNIANVIAMSERAKNKTTGKDGGKNEKGEGGVQQWLLDALPDVSKKSKHELKRRGVESRRTALDKGDASMKRKGRISTKSGFQRRLEDRRRGAVEGSQRRTAALETVDGGRDEADVEDEEWGGFDE